MSWISLDEMRDEMRDEMSWISLDEMNEQVSMRLGVTVVSTRCN